MSRGSHQLQQNCAAAGRIPLPGVIMQYSIVHKPCAVLSLPACPWALLLPAAGGLPGSWLGKYKVLRNLKYMDLSGNQLGTTDGETLATRDQWCETDTANNWKPGSGWCPTVAPLEGTAASLEYLNLADNSLTGRGGAAEGDWLGGGVAGMVSALRAAAAT